jgi:hypothetical protein
MHDASPAAFAAFVSTLETSGKRDPVENFGGGTMIPASISDASIAQAVTAFASGRGAGAFEHASAEAEKFIAFRAKCPSTSVTIHEWLSTAASRNSNSK